MGPEASVATQAAARGEAVRVEGMADGKIKCSETSQTLRELRDENARLRKELKVMKSKDIGPQKGFTRLITALAAITMYNVIYSVDGFLKRVGVFCALVLLAKLAGLPFAPLHVPSNRRIQMFFVLLTFAPLNMIECTSLYFAYAWYFRNNMSMIVPWIAYAIYIFFDRNPSRGGYRWCKNWFRSLYLHRFVAEYYPCKLIKTADLPKDQNFVFGYHPHGVISIGAQANFGTDATGFKQLFPGIEMTLMTLRLTFRVPIFREWVMAHGLASCGERSCNKILSETNMGRAIMIVIGGAAESLDARPDYMDLTILKRKGFVRIALKNGAWLVPVISFGENDVFGAIPNRRGSVIRKVQNWLQKKLGVAPVVFVGRGIFQYAFGVLPHRRPITSVVGAPIKCPHVPGVVRGDEVIDFWHKKYVDALKKLHDEHKDKYAPTSADLRLY
mmetsp:Transcript_19680/g.35106  ORF Transcript_19680/g.35106 Transcript_19680/m.35106 type:complete len:444 (+) Transcript_19680:25-1356(+)